MTRFDEQEQKVTITISMIMTFLFLIDFGYWHVKLFVCHLIVFVVYYTKEDTISLHTVTTVVVVVWPEAIRHHIGVTDERTCGNFLQCDGNIV